MSMYRTHQCNDLNSTLSGQKVRLSGWVDSIRDHGGVRFIDLRDRSGKCQVVLPPELSDSQKIRNESVLSIEGIVQERPEGMVNTKLQSGSIEVQTENLKILSLAEALPFPIEDKAEGVGENTRLKYRYLDLRRGPLQKALKLRHKMLQETRKFFTEKDFLEVETPFLYKSTPEGARDYLVPSRVYPGSFYALPQSPQMLKQLLMVSGFERYFQIVKCFRDEDLRADRQPEFTQVDLEMSFLELEELLKIQENYLQHLWKNCIGAEIKAPFQRISYKEAIESYGSDKPDLRFGLKLNNISSDFKSCSFKVFNTVLENGGSIVSLALKQEDIQSEVDSWPQWSRKILESFNSSVTPFGLKGVAWVRIEEQGLWSGPIAKFFEEEFQKNFSKKHGLHPQDYVFLGAGEAPRIFHAMGQLRLDLAKKLALKSLQDPSHWAFAWVTEFPLFEYDSSSDKLFAAHHPFTRPLDEDKDLLLNAKNLNELTQVRAQAYDITLNGYEIGGGSLRIHEPELQESMFRALKLSLEEIKEKFGFFVEALTYGTPPHGGIAYGFDRMAMLMNGSDSLKEVIAFPKTASASCLMSSCPSRVEGEQLAELKIRTETPKD